MRQGFQYIPIIAVTAYTHPGDRERFLAAGMDNYLGMPVGIKDLENVLEKHARQVTSAIGNRDTQSKTHEAQQRQRPWL